MLAVIVLAALLQGAGWQDEIEQFAEQVKQTIRDEDLAWAENVASDGLAREQFLGALESGVLAQRAPCRAENMEEILDESAIRIFISFSIPESILLSLSRELEEFGGVFVLRGLPDDSFAELARQVQALGERGVTAPIQIDPEAFERFDVRSVPVIAYTHEGTVDKVQGCVSLRWALEYMQEGEE